MDQEVVLSRVPCGILVLDKKGRIVYANERILKLTGLQPKQIPGCSASVIGLGTDDTDSAVSGKEWWDWAQGTTIHMRSSLIDANYVRIPVFISGRRHTSQNGETHLFLSVLDVTHIENWAVEKKQHPEARDHYFGLIGKAPCMQELYNLIKMSSSTGVNVVIMGESGTGKELVASAIHKSSVRNGNSFVRINCAALSETLLESELFGHVKGAFTGAYRDRKGSFETAHKGSILLDEIGEISPVLQAKLLRVIQERVIVRVGDNKEIQVDVRIIAATNKNLRRLVKKGVFREDLFYRLNVFPIYIPSLNDRKQDIPLLCNHFLNKCRRETGKNIFSISKETMRLFMDYCWPGNVRELENTIEHAFVLCGTEEIQLTDLPRDLRINVVREGICAEKEAGILPSVSSLTVPIKKINGRLRVTKEQLIEELKKHGGNKQATARSLGISKVGLWKKLKKLGINE